MKRVIGKSWRDSASLILLNKRNCDALSYRGAVNYDVLLQTRTSAASFPNSVVFPGGVAEPSDESPGWLKLIQSFGYSQDDFSALHRANTSVTPIFQPNPVEKHVSLRITAIRETFEELGLLICSRQHKKDKNSLRASTLLDIDVKHWQNRVSKNPEELLNLCEERNCYPDIWSLHYWSNWLSPDNLPRRFDTAFFLAALDKDPPSIESSSEVTKVQWSNPGDILEKNSKEELELYPPQVYELNRISQISSIDDLIEYARERSCYADEHFYPVVVKTKDGVLFVLPGDDLYPSNVDYVKDSTTLKDKTVLELRNSCTNINRLEKVHANGLAATYILKNYKPLNHINMGDRVIEAKVTLHKTK